MDRPNFEAPAYLLDLEKWRDGIILELLQRLRLTMATVDPTRSGFGIVDAENPNTSTVLSGRPLSVSVNTANTSTVDVSAGTVVFPNGEIIQIRDLQTQIALASLAGNAVNVLYLYFNERPSDERALTHSDTLVSLGVVHLASDSEYFRSATLADYLSFTAAEMLRIVPIAVVSIEVTAAGNVLVIDMGTGTLSANRPWFTAVDLRHRRQLGTGLPTETNPHGTSLNDMSATAGKTLYQLLLNTGMIVGKDIDIAKVPGFLCYETILPAAVTVDGAGIFTGVVGARFFRLARFPVNILDATNAINTLDYAVARVPRTNVCFFNPAEPWDGSAINIVYSCVSAAEPPATLNPISITVRQPQSIEEAIIAGGVGLSVVNQPTLSFVDAGQIPAVYVAYIGADGRLEKYPQVVVTQTRLSVVGGVLQTPTIAMRGRARIRIALTKAVAGAGLAIGIRITGRNNGILTQEVLNFGAGWSEPVAYPSCGEYPSMFVTSVNVYDELTSYVVLTRAGDGPASEILMWAMIDPVTTQSMEDILPVADITWDALKICRMEDIRPVNTSMALPRASKYVDGAKALAHISPAFIGAGYLFNYWLEDFDLPAYVALTYRELSPTIEPGPVFTNIRKIGEGLDRRSTYVGRPVPVKPHSATPFALRFIPIEPSAGFTLRVRVVMGSPSTWSRWFQIGDLSGPPYTLFLGSLGGAPLRKWQMVVTGIVKGMVVSYLTVSADPGLPSLIVDVGAFDEGSLG